MRRTTRAPMNPEPSNLTRARCSALLAALLIVAPVAPSAHAAPRGKRHPRDVALGLSVQPGPQCHLGRHTLTYHGGDLVQNVAVFILFWGPEWQTDAEHQAAAASLRTMYHQLGGSEYGCSWQEFALPGSPIGGGSYAGDEIIPTPPVSPGQQLDDADIQARILTEVQAHRAPDATDDTFYVVVPPKGVPVIAGGETGCGGTNFTFCGYHDSFASGGKRLRYTVLPYPCSSGGATCFVDFQESVVPSFQAVGSHELSETVTDPDQPPVGGSGWFDDHSGDEDADICASDTCLVDLPVGVDAFTVNSLWSNLGGDCVASAPCAVPPAACTDPAPGACVTNTRSPQACDLEWHVEPNLTRDRNGFAGGVVSCADGQPFCDVDATADGRCTFHVAVCLNSTDPRFACTASAVDSVQLRGKLARSSDPTDNANAAALLPALENADPGSAGAATGSVVTYTPAAATSDACSSYVDVVVPVKSRNGRITPGKRTLQVATRTATSKVSEKLTLICTPTFL
ncbi:MAG: hypothetical protein HY271_19780 [Deltaproteobacteria bacterium]|nr:hypothetical protein [Deltaproteobacteria bacterium]